MTGTAGAVRYNTVLTWPVYGPSRPKSLNSTIIGSPYSGIRLRNLAPLDLMANLGKFTPTCCKLSSATQYAIGGVPHLTNHGLGFYDVISPKRKALCT